jgi:hypothetical protein
LEFIAFDILELDVLECNSQLKISNRRAFGMRRTMNEFKA